MGMPAAEECRQNWERRKREYACVYIKPPKKYAGKCIHFFKIWPARWAGFLNVHACVYILNTLPAAAGKKKVGNIVYALLFLARPL